MLLTSNSGIFGLIELRVCAYSDPTKVKIPADAASAAGVKDGRALGDGPWSGRSLL